MEKGIFVVFEGINGCGKGEQINLFSSYLRSLGKAVPIFTTGEPNDFDKYGKLARKMLSSDGNPYQNNLEAVEYFAKNRITHNKIFNPMLEKGIYIISDRYWESNFAFQHAQGISYAQIAKANLSSRKPDLTYIIDVPVKVGFERLKKRDGKSRRKFDSHLDFMEKVRKNYLELREILQENIGYYKIVYINGNQSIENVQQEIRCCIKKQLRI